VVDTALTRTASDRVRVEGGAAQRAAAQASPRLAPATAWALACLAVDATMLVLAGLATSVGAAAGGFASAPIGWTIGFGVLTLALFRTRGLYALRLRLRTLDDLRAIATATTLAAMIVLSVRILLGNSLDLAAESIRPWAFALVYLASGRIALHWSQTKARAQGENVRRTLIVGAGKIGSLTAKRLLETPELGLKPVAFLDKDPLVDPSETLGLPVAGASWDLDAVVSQFGIDQVIVTFSTAPDEVLLRLVRRCEELGIAVSVVPRLFERVPERHSVEHVGGIPLLTAHPANPKSLQFAVKYALDRLVAAVALVLLSPVMAATALAVWISLGRPIFFRQTRVGRDGRTFEILKFRTMRQTSDSPEPTDFQLPDGVGPGGVEGDDRRTRLGAFLRASSIDELPQLFNVVLGQMSIVGPRPERPEYVSQFERNVYRYGERHRVKSGITGWSQVHGLRGKTSIADRAEWDNFYIENFSLWLDVKIMALTIGAVLGCFARVE
jgi:exopolysaccharide biosynthesis polyprenyl glycosylphosphotransferase